MPDRAIRTCPTCPHSAPTALRRARRALATSVARFLKPFERGAAIRHPLERLLELRRPLPPAGRAPSSSSPYSSNDGLIGSAGPDGASSVSSIAVASFSSFSAPAVSFCATASAACDFLLHDRERLRAIGVRARLGLRAHRLQLLDRDRAPSPCRRASPRSARRRARTPRCRRSPARRRPSPRRSAAPSFSHFAVSTTWRAFIDA